MVFGTCGKDTASTQVSIRIQIEDFSESLHLLLTVRLHGSAVEVRRKAHFSTGTLCYSLIIPQYCKTLRFVSQDLCLKNGASASANAPLFWHRAGDHSTGKIPNPLDVSNIILEIIVRMLFVDT